MLIRVFLEVLMVVMAEALAQEETHTLATLVLLVGDPSSIRQAAWTILTVQVRHLHSKLFTNASTHRSYPDIPGTGGTSGTGDAQGGDAAFKKRALNSDTAGGNAQSGDSSNTSSGSIFNEAEGDDGEITNTDSSKSFTY
jgi:hypothetical protein